ncbi:MAG: hypothetical protein QXG97_07790 [Nitrososphaerota archaeon]
MRHKGSIHQRGARNPRTSSISSEDLGGWSPLITLHTPNTGFMEADAKIAFGLARVALELTATGQLAIRPHQGVYQVRLDMRGEDVTKLDQSFRLLCSRVLSSERRYMLPGVQPKYRALYKERVTAIARGEVKFSLVDMYRGIVGGESSLFTLKCNHKDLPSFGGVDGGFLLGFSGHVGKPYARDKVSGRKNLGLCVVCSALSMLGMQCSSIEVSLGANATVTMFPLPLGNVNLRDFNYLVSAVKTFPYQWFNAVPGQLMPLVAVAHHPQLASAMKHAEYLGSIHVFQQQKGAWTVRSSATIRLRPIVDFVLWGAFNQAVVSRLVSRTRDRPSKVGPLLELFYALLGESLSDRRTHAMNFSRAYVKDLSPETSDMAYALLYPQTAAFLLMEVGAVDESLVKNESVLNVARMLNYFVRSRNYGYVDSIRNARDHLTFKDTLVKALREAQTRRAAGEFVHIPSSLDLQEVSRFAESSDMFQDVKLTLSMLALSYIPARAEKEDQGGK